MRRQTSEASSIALNRDGRAGATRCSVKKVALVVLAAALGLAAPARAQEKAAAPAEDAKAAPHRRWQDLKLPPVRQFAAPKPERREIDGMVVYLLEDHELPTIDLVALVRAGSVYEPREKAGLASICGEVMRSGGIVNALGDPHPSGDELDEQLESIAASAETGIALWQGHASCSALKESFPAALAVLAQVMTSPAFREEKIDLAKKQRKSAIARRNDDPGGIARREFHRALYGDASPYGWTDEVATIEAVTRDDIVAFHKKYFRRDRTIVGVVGDFKTEDMAAAIAKAFAKYPKSDGPLPAAPALANAPAPKIFLVKKPDVNQSTIYMGHPGIQRRPDDPDYCAAIVANTILGGGGFAARLLQHVRTDLGLAYGVFSNMDAPYSHRGLFYLECQTKCTTTLQAIKAMRAELVRLTAEKASAEELRVAKESILQSLVFASESRKDVIERALRYEYYGFPPDYLEKFQAGIAAVTAEDAARVAKKLMHPEELTMVVVGNDGEFDGKLDSLGEVTVLDVKKPAFAGKAGGAPVASADQRAKAQAIVAQAIEAHGGKAALEGLKTLHSKGTVKISMGPQSVQIKLETLVAYSRAVKLTTMTPMGAMTECIDGESAWALTPGGVQDLPEREAQGLKDELRGERILLDLAADAGASYAGDGDVDGKKAEIVAASGRKYWFDAADHRLVRQDSEDGTSVTLSDHRMVSGVLFAFRQKASKDGQDMESVQEEITVNPEIPEDAFARPSGDAPPPRPRPAKPGGAGAGR